MHLQSILLEGLLTKRQITGRCKHRVITHSGWWWAPGLAAVKPCAPRPEGPREQQQLTDLGGGSPPALCLYSGSGRHSQGGRDLIKTWPQSLFFLHFCGGEGDQNCPLAKLNWDPGDRRTHWCDAQRSALGDGQQRRMGSGGRGRWKLPAPLPCCAHSWRASLTDLQRVHSLVPGEGVRVDGLGVWGQQRGTLLHIGWIKNKILL